jgi:hypothetical protein
MSGEADRSDYDRLRDFWRGQWGGEGFEDRWRKTLVDGVVEGSRPQAVPRPAAQLPDWTPPARQEGYAIVYRPDHLSSTGGSRTTHGFRNVRSPSRRQYGATRSRCRRRMPPTRRLRKAGRILPSHRACAAQTTWREARRPGPRRPWGYIGARRVTYMSPARNYKCIDTRRPGPPY